MACREPLQTGSRRTSQVETASGFCPRVKVVTSASGWIGKAGESLLTETVVATGPGRELSVALASWRKVTAVHSPAKVVVGLAVTLALGGDHLAEGALLCAEPGIYGQVASDLTVSHAVAVFAGHGHDGCVWSPELAPFGGVLIRWIPADVATVGLGMLRL